MHFIANCTKVMVTRVVALESIATTIIALQQSMITKMITKMIALVKALSVVKNE